MNKNNVLRWGSLAILPIGAMARDLISRGSVALFVCAISLMPAGPAHAESMFEALVSAYVANPTLNAARAQQRATDEEVPRARSGFRPTIIGSGEIDYQNSNTKPAQIGDGDDTTKRYGVTLTQPIFRGFRTINSVREAEASVRAGRQELKLTEQLTLIQGVDAYMSVVRDQAIVRLRRNNVKVLREQYEATKDRFNVGEVTKTDVAQAEARLSGARSQLSLANANLETSRAAYERVIGHKAAKVVSPGSLSHILPKTLKIALDVGLEENPEVLAAEFRKRASRHAVDTVRGELLPEVNVQASYFKNFDPSSFVDDRETTTVTGRLTVPLYQAGDVSARVRQSKHTYQQRRDQLAEARDKVRSDIVTAWSQLASARAQIVSDQAQVAANKTALTGVREEEQVGQRTILDVLDAEQEYLVSQVNLVGTKRDLVVASFNVLASVGRLTATDLGLPVEYYDPEEHYLEVRRKWIGTGPSIHRDETDDSARF